MRPEAEIAERRAQDAAAREDEVEIVAVAVREVDRVGLVGMEDREDDVVVEQQRHARVDDGAAPSGQLLRAVVAAGQRARLVVGVGRDLPAVRRRSPATLGCGRSRWYMMVYGPSNPPRVRHSSWRRRPRFVAQRRVRACREPRRPPCDPASSLHSGYALARACSRSIASNSARKFPAPNPWSPLRWMISKKNGPASGSW